MTDSALLDTRLLRLLARPGYHSGTALGAELGISRAAVNQRLQRLRDSGLPLDAVRSRGYRLADGVVPLCAGRIRRAMGAPCAVQVHRQLPGTSAHLLEQRPPPPAACLAEAQSAGRGRRGNIWVAQPWRNLMLSLSWRFGHWPETIGALSLAASLALVQALESLGATGLRLKWPNDLLWRGRKLGGLLIDVRGETGGNCDLVLGAGINVRQSEREQIDQPIADLADQGLGDIDRNLLAAVCLDALTGMLEGFADDGFEPLRELWNERCEHLGRPVVAGTKDLSLYGTMRGVNNMGALLLEQDGGQVLALTDPELSLRPA